MYVLIDGTFRPLENAREITPVLKGNRVSVILGYDGLPNSEVDGDQAIGVLESVLKRRVGRSSNAALEAMFTAIETTKPQTDTTTPPPTPEQAQQIAVVMDGVRKRRPRRLANPENTSLISSLMASRRWYHKNGDPAKFKNFGRQALDNEQVKAKLDPEVIQELKALGVK